MTDNPFEEMPPSGHPTPSGFRFNPRDSAAFAAERHARPWLVEQVLAAGQPAVIGGPKKSLKTSIAVDLAISLGSGKPFLGKFAVPQQTRVAVLSGESGTATLQETARRVCQAKDVRLEACDVLWQTDLPLLSAQADRDALKHGLAAAGVKVVIIDPLFLCLVGGGEKVTASNLYEVGPLLWKSCAACLEAGATPVLIHHTTKFASKKAEAAEPPDLDDLAFAGIGEFARQWLLLGRRAPYQPGTGRNALVLTLGGSAGHSSVWALDVDEGVLGSDGKGRHWEVRVCAFQGACPEATRPASNAGRATPSGSSSIRKTNRAPGR